MPAVQRQERRVLPAQIDGEPPIRSRGPIAVLATCALVTASCLPYGRSRSPSPPAALPDAYAVSASARGSTAGDRPGAPIAGDAPERGEPARSDAAAEPPPPAGAEPPPWPAATPAGAPWWAAFGDPTLERLISQALADNVDLHVAWARVQQAQAQAMAAGAARWPQISAQGEATWNRSVLAFLGRTADQTTLRASLPVSYEVDWFAKNAGRAEAAKLDVQASRADTESVAISIAAEVAEAWFDVLEARARAALLKEDLGVNEEVLELVKLRFRQGLAPALDAHQQRQQVATTRAQLQLAEMAERTARGRLAVLLGDMPRGQSYAQARSKLPPLPPPPRAGVPGDLLTQRPDVRAAAKRIQAADEQVAVAVASRLPTLTLNGNFGYSWTKFVAGEVAATPMNGEAATVGAIDSQWRSGESYTVGGILQFPIFDGFQRRAEIKQNRARLIEALENHERVLQQAVLEVDTALVSERDQLRRIEALNEQLNAARDTLHAAGDRYREGLTEFLTFLTALQSVQQTELAVLSARRQQLSYRIQLHRALGGSWSRDLSAPPAHEKSP